MELRVWVDGTQRVVCGVKLTTTCQEIVFALAHATQQAGRFTMIERWRNNERLLSPNEQPLVTLQRWGDHMNEVEFILRKTSTDLPTTQIQQQHQAQQVNNRPKTDNDAIKNNLNQSGGCDSPMNNVIPAINQQMIIDQPHIDSMYQQQLNLNRRPQSIMGQMTSSSSSLGLGPAYLTPPQPVNRLPNSFRSSISASTLPSATNGATASQSHPAPMSRPHYMDDQLINTNPSLLRYTHNGYPMKSESQVQHINSQIQPEHSQVSKNHPFEDLYSTINKKRIIQPPAVPAKPRIVAPNIPLSHQQIKSINNTQLNFYHQNSSSLNMYQTSLRPRHPPGYLDYMEAVANRNSSAQPTLPNMSHNQHLSQGNIFRSFDNQVYSMNNGPSPVNSSNSSGRYHFPSNGQATNDQNCESTRIQGATTIRPKLIDSGLVINRGSAINVKLASNSQNLTSHSLSTNERIENNQVASIDTTSSVSQVGLDMLRVIEEQKKVLLNQKNELDRLDNDQEYWETKQNSEQTELIKRIEDEIRQLEQLWAENQSQIKKLESHNFDRELGELRSEQLKMELEIAKQKEKLIRCEKDIDSCKEKIEQLEAELADQHSNSEDNNCSSSDDDHNELHSDILKSNVPKVNNISDNGKFKLNRLDLQTNGTRVINGENGLGKEAKSSEDDNDDDEEEEEEDDDDSGADASDDLKLPSTDIKPRSVKDMAYVDKRGIISGIRSLKLEKTRALSRQFDNLKQSSDNNNSTYPNSPKDKVILNDTGSDKKGGVVETNGQCTDKTANNNNNKYEFLMTL